MPADSDDVDPGEYCRRVEQYLCRKNDGHLVRIAGPSFTRVCGWSEQGIPLNVVYRGVDRYFERYYAKGARRRPVHIDFCEADVLDVFDEWRRAVGVFPAAAGAAEGAAAEPAGGVASAAPRHTSLPAHLERAIARLTTMRAGGVLSPAVDTAVSATARELDTMRAAAAQARGEARASLVSRLHALDDALLATLRDWIGEGEQRALEEAARADLARFKGGMTPEAHERAVAASTTRMLRDRTGMPDLRYQD